MKGRLPFPQPRRVQDDEFDRDPTSRGRVVEGEGQRMSTDEVSVAPVGWRKTVSDWLTPSTLPVLIAGAGVIVYAVLHLSLEAYYAPFRVTPEDAGFDRVT